MTTPTLPSLAFTALSPVATGASFCRLSGVLWATVIVKATFQLVHGEAARLIAAEELVPRDQANAPGQSLGRARETMQHLPNAGVLLTGHACATDGRAVPSMSVRLGLSRERPMVDKTLHVFGARAVDNPAAIAPFQKMPLVYERAFGGAGVWENPLGTGAPGSRVLPNIVDPKDPRKVAGFGPLAPQWASRRALLRGVDPAAMEAPIWDVPAGFDWRFFQAAPQDQQMDKLHGDEWIVLDGMDPSRPRVQSRLPQVTAHARRHVVDSRGVAAESAVELRADMLVIDADRLVASLVWRGRFAVESPEALSRTRVLVGLEQPGRSIAWPAPEPPKPAAAATLETQEVNLSAILGASVPFAPERESHLPPPSVARPQPKFSGTAAVDIQAILKGPVPFAEAVETAALPALKAADSVEMVETTALPAMRGAESTGTAETAALPAIKGAESAPLPSAVLSTAGVIAAPKVDPLPFEPADSARPSTASVPTPAAERASRLVTGTTDINLGQLLRGATPFGRREATGAGLAAPLPPPMAAIPGPMPPPMAAVPAPPPPAISASPPPVAVSVSAAVPEPLPVFGQPLGSSIPRDAPPLPVSPSSASAMAPGDRGTSGVVGASTAREPPPRPPQEAAPQPASSRATSPEAATARARVMEKLERKEPLDGEDLAGANLSGLDLAGCSLVRCNLRGAKLRGTKLPGATLMFAVLDEADLRGAKLDGADLSDASLVNADLEQASLANAAAPRANLRDARILNADLRGAKLMQACFRGAGMCGVQASGADLGEARLDGADLTGASLRAVIAARAVFAGAVLDQCDLQEADLRGANLHKASTRRARMAGADLASTSDAPPDEED